jgi:hypothetical protein
MQKYDWMLLARALLVGGCKGEGITEDAEERVENGYLMSTLVWFLWVTWEFAPFLVKTVTCAFKEYE